MEVAVNLVAGILDDAYQQAFVSVRLLFEERYLQGEQARGGEGFFQSRDYYVRGYKWVLRGEWELGALILLGIGITLAPRNVSKLFRSPRRVVPLLSGLAMLGASLLSFDGGLRDILVIFAPLVSFGALAVTLLVLNGRRSWVGDRFRNRPVTAIILLLAATFFGWLLIKAIFT